MANDELVLDTTKQSIRGRSCPQCGGKIIPSNRAVYQGTGDASEVFLSWQCERCGYEEVYEPRKPEKGKHTK